MAEIINLRRARKQAKRAEHATTAAANRLAYGEAKASKAARTAEARRREATLNGSQRSKDGPARDQDPDTTT